MVTQTRDNSQVGKNRCVFKAHWKAFTDSDSLRYTGKSFQSFEATVKKDESSACFLERGTKNHTVVEEDILKSLPAFRSLIDS